MADVAAALRAIRTAGRGGGGGMVGVQANKAEVMFQDWLHQLPQGKLTKAALDELVKRAAEHGLQAQVVLDFGELEVSVANALTTPPSSTAREEKALTFGANVPTIEK